MNDFDEVEYVRAIRTDPFDIVIRWNIAPFQNIANKDIPEASLVGSKAHYFYRLGLASSFLSAIRQEYPFAFLLTNDKTSVREESGGNRDWHEIPWFFAWDSEVVLKDDISLLRDLGQGDFSPYIDGLLGLYPYPITYVLLLSRQAQRLSETLAHLTKLRVGEEWKGPLAEVFDVILLSSEEEYLSVVTKHRYLASQLGYKE